MTRPLLLALLVLTLALPPAAQSYGVVATQSDLADGGTLTDPVPFCLDYRAAQDDFVFFDDTGDLLATYDPGAAPGSRTTILRSAAALDADTGVDVVVCRDLDTDDAGNVYLGLSAADNADRVYRTDAAGTTGTVLTNPSSGSDDGDGITGVVVDGTTLYLARGEFFGAPEDGVYRLNTTGAGQTPTAVVIDAGLDLTGLDLASTGDLYATSSEFGVGALQNVIVTVADPGGAATLSTIATPCTGGSPIFENCSDGGVEDLKVGFLEVSGGEQEFVFAFNNSFGAPEGEAVGQFDLDGANPETVFTQARLITETGITEFTPAGTGNGYMDFVNRTLYLAGSGSFDGTVCIFSVAFISVLASEPSAPESAFALTVWPNPVRGEASVRVTADATQVLEVAAYDLLGRRVALLYHGTALAGAPITVRLDGSSLPPGVYVVRATGETGMAAHRVTVVR